MKGKILISLVIATALLLSTASVGLAATDGAAPTVEFSDIKGHWAEAAIKAAVKRGYVNGYPDGTFRPEDRVKIDEFIKMMIVSLYIRHEDGNYSWDWDLYNRMPDFAKYAFMNPVEGFSLKGSKSPTGYWADPYIDQAAEVLGAFFSRDSHVWNNRFDIPLTRELAAVLAEGMMVVLGTGETTRSYLDLIESEIPDIKQATHKRSVAKAAAIGVIAGYPDGTFRPKGYITRAEAITVINRISDRSQRLPKEVDLTGKHYVEGTTYWDNEIRYVFKEKEFLDLILALKSLKDSTRFYGRDNIASIEFATSQEDWERWYRERTSFGFPTINPIVMRVGTFNNVDSMDLVVTVGRGATKEDFDRIIGVFASHLFEGQAQEFLELYATKYEQLQNGGANSVKSESLVLNGREVQVYAQDDYLAIGVSLKR